MQALAPIKPILAPIKPILAPIKAKEEHPSKIKDWAEADRPREKLIAKGPQALSDSELLALIVPGTLKHNAIDQARLILEKYDYDLQALGRSTPATSPN